MKNLLLLLLFLSFGTLQSQNLYTNAQDLVYPVLEEFVSKNYSNGTPTMEQLNKLDSIVVKDLGYTYVNEYIRAKNLGFHHREGDVHWIEIDSILLSDPEKFKDSLLHELGHMFKLHHINVKDLPLDNPLNYEIMAVPEKFGRYLHVSKLKPDIWKTVNDNYYKSLQTLKK